MGYAFRTATLADLPLLQSWLAQPHLKEWWDDGDTFDADDLTDQRVDPRMVEWDGTPFAYMQDYDPHGWDDHYFGDLPPGSRGIDQFIGVPDMVGRGHGTAFIAARLAQLFDSGAPVIGTDPHPDNARAIAVYTKVGFTPAGPVLDTEWGRILPMHATP